MSLYDLVVVSNNELVSSLERPKSKSFLVGYGRDVENISVCYYAKANKNMASNAYGAYLNSAHRPLHYRAHRIRHFQAERRRQKKMCECSSCVFTCKMAPGTHVSYLNITIDDSVVHHLCIMASQIV